MISKIVYHRNGTQSYFLDGKEVTQKEFEEAKPAQEMGEIFATMTGWPKASIALAVHPKQVAAANENLKKHGIKTRYRADGVAIIPDNADRRRLLKHEGLVDKDSFY